MDYPKFDTPSLSLQNPGPGPDLLKLLINIFTHTANKIRPSPTSKYFSNVANMSSCDGIKYLDIFIVRSAKIDLKKSHLKNL